MAIGQPDDHTAGAIAALTGAVTLGGTAMPVVDTEATDAQSPPYLVVQSSPGGGIDGPLGAPHDDLDYVLLVKAVTERNPADGQGRAQCEYALGKARELILGGITVSGRRVNSARLDVPGAPMLDKSVQPYLFYAVDRYVIPTSPS